MKIVAEEMKTMQLEHVMKNRAELERSEWDLVHKMKNDFWTLNMNIDKRMASDITERNAKLAEFSEMFSDRISKLQEGVDEKLYRNFDVWDVKKHQSDLRNDLDTMKDRLETALLPWLEHDINTKFEHEMNKLEHKIINEKVPTVL